MVGRRFGATFESVMATVGRTGFLTFAGELEFASFVSFEVDFFKSETH